MNLYSLPDRAVFGGREYPHRTDFREMMTVFSVLNDEKKPEFLRWYTAISYFFTEEIPAQHRVAAMEYLADFLTCGERGSPGPRLFDWEQDATAIIADVNTAAGREVRSEQLHWWTFLSYFHGIREGQLSNLIAIRQKLRRGEKLSDHEQAFYRDNPEKVRLRRKSPPDPEKARLIAMLDAPRCPAKNAPSKEGASH